MDQDTDWIDIKGVEKISGPNPERFLREFNIECVKDYGRGRNCGKRYVKEEVIEAKRQQEALKKIKKIYSECKSIPKRNSISAKQEREAALKFAS